MNRYVVRPEDCVLMVVDIQEKLFNAMEEEFKEIFLKNSRIILDVAKSFNIPIIVSEQYPKGLGRTIDEIDCLIKDIPRHEKLYFSCLRDEYIRKQVQSQARKTVIVTGIETHVCVLQTVLDLLMSGYRVVVVNDAVCSRRSSDMATAISAMMGAGAVSYSTETLAFMFMEKAGTHRFKELSKLFK